MRVQHYNLVGVVAVNVNLQSECSLHRRPVSEWDGSFIKQLPAVKDNKARFIVFAAVAQVVSSIGLGTGCKLDPETS
jgi:hypothetical protein